MDLLRSSRVLNKSLIEDGRVFWSKILRFHKTDERKINISRDEKLEAHSSHDQDRR